ncbi:variant erythrocyte surface antigen-1 family protein [Babesia caballi]|uniref:Variant erythrocyte surface antigen-1 family protein n=1 Tax=Babesia caballi TaxID=5871 RepID=A0AAV4M4U5_BABCB|nr:variant erythrocyte surface antigen-1 family protein [Babesia caballi]
MGAQSSKIGTNGPFTCLTQQPRNLKEAIDWVLRFSGRDKRSTDYHKEAKIGADAVKCLSHAIIEVLKQVSYDKLEVLKDFTNKKALLIGDCQAKDCETCPSIILENLIDNLTESLRIFIGYDDKWEGTITGEGIAIGNNGLGVDGKREKPSPPWKSIEIKRQNKSREGYALAYNPDSAVWEKTWKKSDQVAQTCAKNFLTAVTLIFEGLTKLYWECRKGNQWSKEKFNKPKVLRLAGYLVSEGFELDGIYTTYVPTQEEIHRSGNKLKQRDNEGGTINGVLSRAFGEFAKVMTPPEDSSAISKWQIPTSYDAFIKAIVDSAEKSNGKLNEIREKHYNGCSANCRNNCEILRRSDAYSTYKEYHFTKLYVLAVVYRIATENCYKAAVFKALGAVGCGAGLGAAAYLTHTSGLLPIIAGFFT